MLFSSPTMMIGAANNSENVDRINLVTLSFSLHSIPASVVSWVKIARYRAEIGDARVSQLSRGGHFDQIDSLGNQMADFEARKKHTSRL
jgi:hypothetical protein